MLSRCLELIRDTAQIPSFSSYEEIIHPYILSVAEAIPGCEVTVVDERNLVLFVPGKGDGRVALSAHLDKINHFGEDAPEKLPFVQGEDYVQGQMDNTVGIGIILALLEQAPNREWPDLLILLSEMEEGMGLREHPELMRDGAKGLYHGMGAERLSQHLIDEDLIPDIVVTVDTTPLFKGKPGCALYSGHWEFTKTVPSPLESARTSEAADRFMQLDDGIIQANNTNDYLTYGKVLNEETGSETAIPSLALEPSIFPYHQRDERVYINDIERVLNLLERYLDVHVPFTKS